MSVALDHMQFIAGPISGSIVSGRPFAGDIDDKRFAFHRPFDVPIHVGTRFLHRPVDDRFAVAYSYTKECRVGLNDLERIRHVIPTGDPGHVALGSSSVIRLA